MSDLFRRGDPGYMANIFVCAEAPQYAAMVAWSKKAPRSDWRLDENGRKGIWVSLNGFYQVNSAGWQQPSRAEMVRQLSQE